MSASNDCPFCGGCSEDVGGIYAMDVPVMIDDAGDGKARYFIVEDVEACWACHEDPVEVLTDVSWTVTSCLHGGSLGKLLDLGDQVCRVREVDRRRWKQADRAHEMRLRIGPPDDDRDHDAEREEREQSDIGV